MRIHIAKGNHKVGHTPNISLPPVLACGNCSKCKHDCYAKKAYRQYPATRKAWNDNFYLATFERDEYFACIDTWIGKHHPQAFRWHVSGDILDQDYLERMKTIADTHPATDFLAFTKMYDLNYLNLPHNLHIVLSGWPGLELRNPYKLYVAWMKDPDTIDDRIPNDAVKCSGDCEHCKRCWALDKIGHDVYFDKH